MPSARPSLRSMHAVAARLRPSSSPALTRGCGYRYLSITVRLSSSRAEGTSASLAEAIGVGGKPDTTFEFSVDCSACKPATAPPTLPLTDTPSPGFAPARVNTPRRLHHP